LVEKAYARPRKVISPRRPVKRAKGLRSDACYSDVNYGLSVMA
jgi:hypothetical protein